MNKNHTQPSGNDGLVIAVERIAVGAYRLVLFTTKGALAFFKGLASRPIPWLAFLGITAALAYIVTEYRYDLQLLHSVWPQVFSGPFMLRWWNVPFSSHWNTLFFGVLVVVSFIIGVRGEWTKKNAKESFQAIGLTNSFGVTPTVLGRTQIDPYRERVRIRANSIGRDRFETKKSDLEAIFQKKIASISHGSNPSVIEIIHNTRELPDAIEYFQLEESSRLRPESFYVGESMDGVIQQPVAEMPHLLIAGTTGGGKSVFFKQVLLSLLKSSPFMQMYLVDLKGGLEFSDFKAAPNVRVVKTLEDAVTLLESVEKEMRGRFTYLEDIGAKEIRPGRHPYDRFAVAVDEASVLYMKRSAADDDAELVGRARELTDSIAKLGRAAGIHLILATQRVMKETIDTVIQENISGRMCFQMNTLHGSLAVLGDKGAMDLPSIPGRGIWLFGNRRVEVQAPYLDAGVIREYCEYLAKEFGEGRRRLLCPMADEVQTKKARTNILRDQLETHGEDA